MDVELIEIREFLAGHPPFDGLPETVLDGLPRQLSVRYLRRGAAFPPVDADQAYLYIVRTGAVELRDRAGELLDKFAEGDLYSATCLSSEQAGVVARAVEDSLFYCLPCAAFQGLLDRHADFNAHFNDSLRSRLRRALESIQYRPSAGALMSVEVRELLKRAPVHVAPTTPIREAAAVMTREGVSALLIIDGARLAGIITDRDLCSRCIAEARSHDEPVSAVMSCDLHGVECSTPAFEALMTMARRNVHHLPVMEGERVAGLISATDLLRYQSNNAVYITADVQRCDSIERLVALSKQLPELQVQLVASGATGNQVGQAISSVTDTITRRLLELAEAELGPAPVPYVWMAGGSQARREQMVHSDQDNALIIDDAFDAAAHDAWFEALAERVTDGLDACGFYYCPGDVMARNSEWRQPAGVWRRYFRDWIEDPEPKSLMLCSNFFDMRPVHGEAALWHEVQGPMLEQARADNIFLAYMAANALHHRPPLGFFRGFVLIRGGDHAKTFDIKQRGALPAVDMVRVYALAAGLAEVNTVDRLHAAAGTSALSEEGAADLEEALALISTFRARHQAEQIKRGEAPDNYLKPEELSPLERSHLKDAFTVVSTMQDALEQRYQTSRLF